ncbi:hypothetical protein TD95_001089 [Thielaviopsis punctulata]|uniref:DH domain-containing protein n=1 Tax=Thielaviopsis punctulata TaxID=72032 RepID=A0A0F4ZIV4_9PEZI|nr:hypothetical protein TD95_001089 [Thielaviopsis punctulata]
MFEGESATTTAASMTKLVSNAPNAYSESHDVTSAQNQALLFGEIPRNDPTATTTSTVRGIDTTPSSRNKTPFPTRHRGVLESDLRIDTSDTAYRSRVAVAASAVQPNNDYSSPIDYCRSANSSSSSSQANDTLPTKKTTVSASSASASVSGIYSTPRSRARSTSESHKIASSRSRMAGTSKIPQPPSALSESPVQVQSRLPISLRKFNGSNSRPSSPTSPTRRPGGRERERERSRTVDYQNGGYTEPFPAMSREKSPFAARMRAATSNNAFSSINGGNITSTPNSGVMNNGSFASHRMAAFVTPTSPKSSPQLRSSRPRQNVPDGTNGPNLRQRTVDPRVRVAQSEQQEANRRISQGPIDFEQRRNDIRLKYTKTIREKQERAAARRRTRELESAAAEAAAIIAAAKASAQAKLRGSNAGLETDGGASLTANNDQEDRRFSYSNSPGRLPTAFEEPVSPTSHAADVSFLPGDDEGEKVTEQVVAAYNKSRDCQGPLARDSPILGLPGGFPLESPLANMGNSSGDNNSPQPQSAVSAVLTEFDLELLPDSTSPRSLGPPPIIEPNRAQTPQSKPTLSRNNTGNSNTGNSNTHLRINYHYPFGDDDEINSGELSPTLPLSPVQVHRREDSNPAAHMHTNFSDGYNEDYESTTPYHQSMTPSTTVRVFRRNSDIANSMGQQPALLPLRDYDYEDSVYRFMPGSAAAIAIRQIQHQDDDTSTCDEESVPPVPPLPSDGRFDTSFSSQRNSTCESSEAEPTGDEAKSGPSSAIFPISQTLNVPSMLIPGNRFSIQSSWTDFSVDSREYGDSTKPSLDIPEVPPIPTDLNNEPRRIVNGRINSSSNSFTESPAATKDSHKLLSPLDQELPPLPVDAFAESDMKTNSTSGEQPLPDIPTNSPPPPAPPSKAGSIYETNRNTPASSFYEHNASGTTLGSRPVSRDRTTIATSITRSSIEKIRIVESNSEVEIRPAVPPKNDQPTDKDNKRLVQRRNVIKELIDTEAAFVRDMSVVWEIYKGTAEACPKLDTKTIKLIFRNTDEIIAFHSQFSQKLRDAVTTVYMPVVGNGEEINNTPEFDTSNIYPPSHELDDAKDFNTTLGSVFSDNIEEMKAIHEIFLRSSDMAAKRLIEIQQDPTVKVWLNECHDVAKDLTAAWDLDSLLIKPMQRITKYPNLIMSMLQQTPQEHPDRAKLVGAKETLEDAIIEINKTKKNFELVGQIVSGKRKDSDVKAGIARAFGKRAEKVQTGSRVPEDEVYVQLNDRFNEDFMRLQVVLRDAVDYTNQASAYVHEFLQYLSSIELVMRIQPSSYPELESKWVQFNVSMRDMEKVGLEHHINQVRKMVIQPFENVIESYYNPALAMKKRQKRRFDYEKAELLKKSGKAVDAKLAELVEQYEALNDTLKKELPILSALTAKVGRICMSNLVNIQTSWYRLWRDRVKSVVGDGREMYEFSEILATFNADFNSVQLPMADLGILNPAYKGKTSLSTLSSVDDAAARARIRPPELSPRQRGLSVNSEAPVIPTPDFARRSSGSLASPLGGIGTVASIPSPSQFYYDSYYTSMPTSSHSQTPLTAHSAPQNAFSGLQSAGMRATPMSPDVVSMPGSRSFVTQSTVSGSTSVSGRPSTGISVDSSSQLTRQSSEIAYYTRRDSTSTYNSNYPESTGVTPAAAKRFSGLFHSALPVPDGPENKPEAMEEEDAAALEAAEMGTGIGMAVGSAAGMGMGMSQAQYQQMLQQSQQASQNQGYNILWLAASLFEFNIETTKQEAGYPYLVYQAGEVFDVIGEKGELWLAKNQDDPSCLVGWIWSKHFAKLAGT